jgi:hypothetical protein
VLAHSTHFRGIGTFESGVGKCSARVTLATAIPESVCKRIHSDSCDSRTINPWNDINRENKGVLLVPKAGEMLFHLKKQPEWAGGV